MAGKHMYYVEAQMIINQDPGSSGMKLVKNKSLDCKPSQTHLAYYLSLERSQMTTDSAEQLLTQIKYATKMSRLQYMSNSHNKIGVMMISSIWSTVIIKF